jgi:hypothetical protein
VKFKLNYNRKHLHWDIYFLPDLTHGKEGLGIADKIAWRTCRKPKLISKRANTKNSRLTNIYQNFGKWIPRLDVDLFHDRH